MSVDFRCWGAGDAWAVAGQTANGRIVILFLRVAILRPAGKFLHAMRYMFLLTKKGGLSLACAFAKDTQQPKEVSGGRVSKRPIMIIGIYPRGLLAGADCNGGDRSRCCKGRVRTSAARHEGKGLVFVRGDARERRGQSRYSRSLACCPSRPFFVYVGLRG